MGRLKHVTARRIAERRKQLNWTQAQLAEYASLSLGMVQRLEQEDRWARDDNLEKIADVMGVDVLWFFTDPDAPMPSDSVPREKVREILIRIAELIGIDPTQRLDK